jgi:hypothetical protein
MHQVDIKYIVCEDIDWIHMSVMQLSGLCFVITLINIWINNMLGSCYLSIYVY